jgi:hypothetical protein
MPAMCVPDSSVVRVKRRPPQTSARTQELAAIQSVVGAGWRPLRTSIVARWKKAQDSILSRNPPTIRTSVLLDSRQLAEILQVPVTWIEAAGTRWKHSFFAIRAQAKVSPICS